MDLVNRFYEFREMCMNTHMKLMQYGKSQDSSQVTSVTEVCVYSIILFYFSPLGRHWGEIPVCLGVVPNRNEYQQPFWG
jgi:hypothetical protein